MRIRTINTICLLFVLLSVTSGKPIYPDPELLRFSKITQKEGLSHNNIECIFKDSDGFVWFGTRNGLCRYNGYDIKVFRSDLASNSISGDRILCINEDREGNLWIGTYSSGLNKFNKVTGQFDHYGQKTGVSERINRIKVFRDGSLWICSDNGLLNYITESDSFRLFQMKPGDAYSLNSDYIHDILETRQGEIYVATDADNIQHFDRRNNVFSQIIYKRSPKFTSNYRKRIVEDQNGILWIAANLHGLSSYNPATDESILYVEGPGQLSTNILMGDMAMDPEGKLWICTDGGGINILDTQSGTFKYIRKDDSKKESLSTDHIYTVYFDELNTIWIGTFGEGVNFYDPARFKFNSSFCCPGDLSILSDKSVISLYQDQKRRFWAGTDGDGLFRFDPDGKIFHYNHNAHDPNSLTTNVITCINEDSKGNILIGTYQGGLVSLNVKTNKYVRFDNTGSPEKSPHSVNIWQILPDSKARIWLGLLGEAVDMFDQESLTFENFGPNSNRRDRIDFPNVMAVMEDSDGDIWFGTEGEGVYIMDSETDRMLRITNDSITEITRQGIIKCFYQDRWGKVWIGSEGQGLYSFDKKNYTMKEFTVENGLPNNMIQSIVEDNQGNLWIGTSNGLSMFNPKTESFRNFIEEDGLSGNEFNPNAFIQLSDGRLATGSTNGLDIFSPETLYLNQNLPRVIISRLEILNHEVLPGQKINGRIILRKSILYTEAITLTHREKIFTLEFAALNYTLPKKCQYKYMLQGSDETWNKTGSDNRKVNYSGLAPGEYVFRVLASNNDGKWGNNERRLIIRVLPPFYNTWWFRGISLILLFAILFFIYQYRLNLHKNRFLQTQAEQEKKISQLEKEKLESELQKMTFHIINRNRMLIDQKNRLLGLSLKAREIVKVGLQDIISKIDEDLSDEKDWVYIEPQLDKVYNNFVTRLKEKHSDLTVAEIKIAAYVRMNLSTKEISEFLHKTPRAIENDRYRLRKKIGLDLNDSLQHYLINL